MPFVCVVRWPGQGAGHTQAVPFSCTYYVPGMSKYFTSCHLTSPLSFIRLINWALAVVSGKEFKMTDEDVSY